MERICFEYKNDPESTVLRAHRSGQLVGTATLTRLGWRVVPGDDDRYGDDTRVFYVRGSNEDAEWALDDLRVEVE